MGADGRLRKQEKDAAVGLPQRVFLRLFAVHRQITATHTGYFPQARHNRAAQLVSLEFTDSTYEFRRLVQFIFAGAVRYNVPRICAALSCRACEDFPVCVAVRCL